MILCINIAFASQPVMGEVYYIRLLSTSKRQYCAEELVLDSVDVSLGWDSKDLEWTRLLRPFSMSEVEVFFEPPDRFVVVKPDSDSAMMRE